MVSSISPAGAAGTIPYFSVGGGAAAWRQKKEVSGGRFRFPSEFGVAGLPRSSRVCGLGQASFASRRRGALRQPARPPCEVDGWSGPAESRASGSAPRLQRQRVSEAAVVRPGAPLPGGRRGDSRRPADVPAGRRARAGAPGGSSEEDAVRCAAARAPELGSELSPPPGILLRRGPAATRARTALAGGSPGAVPRLVQAARSGAVALLRGI